MLDLLSRVFQSVVTPMLWLSLTAAFVAVIVMILRRILRSRIPHLALCVLWLIVFARLLLPVSIETPFSLVPSNITNQIYQTEQETEQSVEPEAETQPSAAVSESPEPVEPKHTQPAPTPVVSNSVSQPQIPATSDPIPSMPVTSSPVISQPENPVASDPVVLEPQLSTPPVVEEEPCLPHEPFLSPKERNGQAIAASVWLLGVAAMMVSGIVSYTKLRRQVYDAIRAEDGVWEHPSLRSPFILGLFRPKIYLPMGILGPARQFILHHERAHLRRWDHVVKPICWLALAVHWFNPFAWGAFLLMSRDIEAACDESVIRKLGSEVKADYSATLLALATDKRFPAPSPLSFGEGDAEERIKNVLKFKKPVLWVSIGAVVVAVIAAVCLLTNQSPRSLDSFYPQVNWETAETVTAYFPKNEFPEDPEKVELSAETAAEMTEVFHNYKYWRELSHLIPDNRIGWYDSLWKVCYQFENGSEITLNYSASGTLVVYHHSGLLPDGSAVNRRDRHYTVDGAEQFTAEILGIIMREFELASVELDLSAYTTMDEYPGLYFLEEPSSTVGTKVTAYKLIDGELVLVGGYEEHQANNFDVLIHADGELEAIWSSQDVYTKFEGLLMAALDPDWTPSAGEGSGETEIPDYELTVHWDTLKKYTYHGETYPMDPVAIQLDLPQPITFRNGTLLGADGEEIGYMALISVDEDLILDETIASQLGVFTPDGTLTTYNGEGMTFSTPWIRAGYDAVAYTSGSGPDILYAYIRVSPTFVFYLSLQGEEYLSQWELCLMKMQVESGITYDTSAMSLLASLPERGLYLYKDRELLYPFLVYQGQQKQLNGTIIDTWIEPEFYPEDRDGDGVEEIVIRFNQGHGTGLMEDGLLACQLYNGQLMVTVHDWSGVANHFNANNSFTYDSQTRTVSLCYGGYTATVVCPDYVDLTGYGSSAIVTGEQVSYRANGDGSFTLSLIPAFSNGDPVAQYFDLDLQCTVRYDGYSFRVTEAPHLVCKDLRENSPPTGTIGDRFLAALDGSGQILSYGPSSTSLQLNTTMDEILDGMLQITQITALDLDGDGTKELLLQMETPSMVYGTEILRYNQRDGRIYGYMLWVRAFMDVKADGTFSYSGGAATNGVARLAFTPEGCEKQVLLHQDFDLDLNGATDDYYYYRNGESITEQEFYNAFESWQTQPNLIWTEYTPETAKALIREHFDVTDAGQSSGQDFLSSLPTEIVTSNTLPTDPEEYYLVAEMPVKNIRLYARNHGQDSMLLWNGNLWWPLDGRIAHSVRLSQPNLYLLDENAESTTVAAVSEVGSGTNMSMKELVVYVMGETKVDSSYSTGMRDYVYNWKTVTNAFNESNSLVYDADTNSLTLFWNGAVFSTGTLAENFAVSQALEDGFVGRLVAGGDIINFTHNGGSSFTVTVLTAIEGRPLSIGTTGFDLTWTVEFNGSGFDQVGGVSVGSALSAVPTTPVYANEIMAIIGGFIEQRKIIPYDYLMYLTEDQRVIAEEYNSRTKTIRGGAAYAAIEVVSAIHGGETSYYEFEDVDYQMIGSLTDMLLYPDYGTQVRENSELDAYLSQRSDSFIRLDSAMAQNFANWAQYPEITFDAYCELAERVYRSLDQSGLIPTTDATMDASMNILERQIVPEDVLLKLDADTVELLEKYNEQTAELKEYYEEKADALRCVLFFEKDRTSQKWYREEFAQRMSVLALYENYRQLVWSDSLTVQAASYENGGSYGLWATSFRHEGAQREIPQNLLDYLSLVESVLNRLKN